MLLMLAQTRPEADLAEPKKTVIGVVADLLDRSRIQGVARAVGAQLSFVSSPDALRGELSTDTEAVFVDLSDPKVDGLAAAQAAAEWRSSEGADNRPSIIGFAPHVDKAKSAEATEGGCDEVLPRPVFFTRLSVILSEAART